MNGLIVALLKLMFRLESKEITTDDIKFHTNGLMEIDFSNIPTELLKLTTEQLNLIITRMGIRGIDRRIYAQNCLLAFAGRRKIVQYSLFSTEAEIEIDKLLVEITESQKQVQKGINTLLDRLGVDSIESAIKKLEEDDPYSILTLVKDLIANDDLRKDRYRTHLIKLYRMIAPVEADMEKTHKKTEEYVLSLLTMRILASQKGFSPSIVFRRIIRKQAKVANIEELKSIDKKIESYFKIRKNVTDVILISNHNH